LKAREAAPPRRKLWHLVVAVLAAAVLFATIRALATDEVGAAGGPYTLVVIALAGLTPLTLVRLGRALGRRTTGVAKRWALERGGVVGFLAWVVALAVESVCYLSALLVSPVAVIFLLLWVARLVGR
jgi:hypothetical protein